MVITILLNKEKNSVDILLDEEGAQVLIDKLEYLKSAEDYIHMGVWSGELTTSRLLNDGSDIIQTMNIGVLSEEKKSNLIP